MTTSKTPAVYVPHVPTRFDPLLNKRTPTLDISSAGAFGTIIMLDCNLSNSTLRFEQLQNFEPCDYILAVGDPVLIAAAIHRAFVESGSDEVKVLRWDKIKKGYQAVTLSEEGACYEQN